MPITAFLKIPDIPGESRRVGHEDEIDVHAMQWGIEHSAPSQVGRGRVRARSDVKPLIVHKGYDAASPLLARAVRQGQSFREVVLTLRKDSGEQHLDYLVVTMTNVMLTSYEVASDPEAGTGGDLVEGLELDFEKVRLLYTRQAVDGSAGDETEVTLNA